MLVTIQNWNGHLEREYTYTNADSCVLDRLNEKAAQILLYGYCLATHTGYFSRMAQVKTMHDKPAYVQTLPMFRLSLQFTRVAA